MTIGVDCQKPVYNIDIVMCIDKTGSMSPILNEVKANARILLEKFVEAMERVGKDIDEFRVKVIAFGDYDYDTRPMLISKFFTLPDENADFEEFLKGINVYGGGDCPENALEALAHAIKSDWTDTGNVHRHVIMLFTDAPALELGTRTDLSKDDEPMEMPSSLAELEKWWEEMEMRAKRLVIFAPNATPWDDLGVAWNNIIHIPSNAGSGCEDVDFDEVIGCICLACG